jgi:DDE_Tnp_1-associated
VPALPSSPISPVLEQLQDLPAGDGAELPGQCRSLAEHLARVPDPRDRRGVRHTLASLLLATIAAVLAGARSLTAVGEWVADAPPQVLAALGVRRDSLTGRFEPPDEATIRRVLETVDAAALDEAVGSWLAARLLQRAGHIIEPASTPLTTMADLTAYGSAHGITLTPKTKPAR